MHATTLTGCMLGIAAVTLVLVGDKALSQPVAPTNSAPNPYRSIENWGTLPNGRAWGSTSAVGIDPDGTSVWVAERCGESRPPSRIDPKASAFACGESTLDPILKFDTSGKLLEELRRRLAAVPARPAYRPRRQHLGDRRARPRRQGPPGVQVQPGRQGAARAWQAEPARQRARSNSTRRPRW